MFKTILCDPPWSYRVWKNKPQYGTADSHYPTMSLHDIIALGEYLHPLTDKDCALLLWATYPNLPEALGVINAWGFKYKTVAFTWVKLTKSGKLFTGLGHYTRANAEVCLLATRGHPRRKSQSVKQVILAPVGKHSEKPYEQYERIEALFEGPYLELFATKPRKGWVSLGYEIDGKDIFDALKELNNLKEVQNGSTRLLHLR